MARAAPADGARQTPCRAWQGETQSGDGDRARAHRIHLGDRARSVTRAVTSRAARTCSFTGFLGGAVARWRTLEGVKRRQLRLRCPCLECGSSATHRSLAVPNPRISAASTVAASSCQMAKKPQRLNSGFARVTRVKLGFKAVKSGPVLNGRQKHNPSARGKTDVGASAADSG